jgi:death-on-curing protein
LQEPSDPFFLSLESVLAIHADQIRLFGGDSGLRDQGLLESAVMAPQNLYLYSNESDIYDLAASYCSHIAGNHAFNDGNKRTGLAAALMFLKINDIDPTQRRHYAPELQFDDLILARMVNARVTGSIDDTALADGLFFMVGPHDVFDCVDKAGKRADQLIKERQFSSKEELEAFAMDAFMTHVTNNLMNLCQQLKINPKRFQKMDAETRAALVQRVAPQYQKQFGMVISEF